MKPPFTLNSQIINLISRIERMIGQIESLQHPIPQPQLRKSNRVKTLRGSLAIEGNSLSEEQITAVLEGRIVIAPKSEIREILNANAVYETLPVLSGRESKDLLNSHKLMMDQLIPDAGKWRMGNVGILKKGIVAHVAPPADRVPYLMTELFDFLSSEEHPLIKSSVFHYEFEFIHPFSDGNGRMGRFWHSLLLYEFHPVFEYIPVESLIKTNQQEYYDVLERCDHAGNSTGFIVFSLQMIEKSLEEFVSLFRPVKDLPESRIEHAKKTFRKGWFTRKDYMSQYKTISSATASRDLRLGVEGGILLKKGERVTTQYQFI